jgi:hypothetical protein
MERDFISQPNFLINKLKIKFTSKIMKIVTELDTKIPHILSTYDSPLTFTPAKSEILLNLLTKDALFDKNAEIWFEKNPKGDGYFIKNDQGYYNSSKGNEIIDYGPFGIHLHRSRKIVLKSKSEASIFVIQEDGPGKYLITCDNKDGELVSCKGQPFIGKPLVRSEKYHIGEQKYNFYFKIDKSLFFVFNPVPELENSKLLFKVNDITLDNDARLFGTEQEQIKCFSNAYFELVKTSIPGIYNIKTKNKFLKFYLEQHKKRKSNATPTSPGTPDISYSDKSKIVITDKKDYSKQEDKDINSFTHETIDKALFSEFIFKGVGNGKYKIFAKLQNSNLHELGIITDNGDIKEMDEPFLHDYKYQNVNFKKVSPVTWEIKKYAIENFVGGKENKFNVFIGILVLILVLIFILILNL